MARNKYPEETVKLILDTAQKLFIEKGYEQTSLQDIIDATKLSKGAIYHHFTSKEDIFIKICDRISQKNALLLAKVRDHPTLNGQEKLQEIFRTTLRSSNQSLLMEIIPYQLLNNPKFLAIQIQDLYADVAPHYLTPILEQGIRDGSIQTEHPQQLAEAILVLSNLWLNPLLQPTSVEAIHARCLVFTQLMQGIGIDLLDDELIQTYTDYAQRLLESGK